MMNVDYSKSAAPAVQLMAAAENILVLSGAGLSAESGIPTFREARTGMWARYAPADLATPEAFAANPERVWAWYYWRRTLIARGGVNAGHRAVAALAERLHMTVATQNVDGLHTAAGSRNVAELHGNIWRERCTDCQAMRQRPVAASDDDTPGRCEYCGAMTRPDVVWFGEMLPAADLERARDGLEAADCVLVIGTSNRVYPAAALVDDAVGSNKAVIEINPNETVISDAVDCRLAAPASRALPALLAALDEVR